MSEMRPNTAKHFVLSFVSPDGRLMQAVLDEDLQLINDEVILDTGTVIAYDWAPDGSRMACVILLPDNTRELRVQAAGAKPTLLGEPIKGEAFSGVSWSPDNRILAVEVGTSASGRELLLYDGVSLRPVSPPLSYAYTYAWAPDGSALALGQSEAVDPPVPVEDGRSASTVIYNFATGTYRVVKRGTSEHMYVPERWLSPNELVLRNYLADGPHQLVKARLNSTGEAELMPLDEELQSRRQAEVTAAAKANLNLGEVTCIVWANDGHYLAFTASQQHESWVYVFSVRSGKVIRVAPGTMPKWKPGEGVAAR